MRFRLRLWLSRVAGRWLRERPVPVGAVAQDRRILRRALPEGTLGRLLVVGSSLPARQAWPRTAVDVVGTSPYAADVTVCSLLDGPGSLPEARWDTILMTEFGEGSTQRLAALRPAGRPGARLVVLERDEGELGRHGVAGALRQVAELQQVHVSRSRRLWMATVSP